MILRALQRCTFCSEVPPLRVRLCRSAPVGMTGSLCGDNKFSAEEAAGRDYATKGNDERDIGEAGDGDSAEAPQAVGLCRT